MKIETWQLILIVVSCVAYGFLLGSVLFYPLGRRHGIEALAQHWRKAVIDDEVARIARNAGAKVRGPTSTKA